MARSDCEPIELTEDDFEAFFIAFPMAKGVLTICPSDPNVWERLFICRFGNLPEPGEDEDNSVRYGSTDPRWDMFLHTEGALQIMNRLSDNWRREGGL